MCYLTVCITVVASLVYLTKSQKAEVKSSHQTKAVLTVIYMTWLFIVFNTLAVMVNLYFMLDWTVLNSVRWEQRLEVKSSFASRPTYFKTAGGYLPKTRVSSPPPSELV